MLTRIYIDNYKCFVNFEQKFDSRFVFFSGRNGVGKTTLFDVLELLRHISVDGKPLEDLDILGDTKTKWLSEISEQSFELDVENKNDKYCYKLVLDEDPKRDEFPRIKNEVVELNGQQIFSFQEGNVILFNDDYRDKSTSFHADWSRSFLANVAERKENSKLIWFRNWLKNVTVISPNPWTIIKNSYSERESFVVKRDLSNFADWFRNIKQSADEDEYQQFIGDISNVIDGLSGIQISPLSDRAKEILVTIKYDGEKKTYRLNELSSGQLLLIALYAVLYFSVKDKTALFCFDEPDNFLALSEISPFIESMFEYSNEGKSQIFITSHHPDFYEYWTLEKGILLQRENNRHIRSLPLEKVAEKYPTLELAEIIRRGWEED